MPKAITIEKQDSEPGKEVYYPLKVIDVPRPTPKPNELLVRMSAAALNHRDVWIRRRLYPGIGFNVPLLADGVGTVISTGSSELDTSWKGKRVLLTPGRGWESSAEGPEEGQYVIIGGTKFSALGTLQEYITVEANEVEEAPAHLNDAEAAALPLTGLTAWRAFFIKSGNAKPGYNILITGIGGGVALSAFQFASAAGCNVFVTSGSEEKLRKAKEMGAQGGVNYRDEQWEKSLLEQLPTARKFLDAVIDGAGGDIVERTSNVLKHGGVIVSYGQTAGRISISMNPVLKNIEIRGSTMGSRKEFSSMVNYVQTKHIRSVISKVIESRLDDIAQLESLFDEMKSANQFGKLVVRILPTDDDGGGSKDGDEKDRKSKL